MKKLPKFSRTNKIKKSSGIPTLSGKSEEEEAHFWDTHSPLDYPGEFTPLDSKHLTGFSEVKEPFEFAPSLLKKNTPTNTHHKIIPNKPHNTTNHLKKSP